MQRALLAMHFGTVFQAKKRPKTVPKPPSTPASIQERFREPPDFDFQAMLGPFWRHVGPMLGRRAPKSSPRGAQAWSLDGPGAAQERPRAPKRPQGAPRRPPEADFGPKIKPTWAHVGSVFGPYSSNCQRGFLAVTTAFCAAKPALCLSCYDDCLDETSVGST